MNPSRRTLLKAAGLTLAMIPVVAVAARNEGMRASMKYRDTPEGDNRCATCNLFVPGKSADAPGGCTIFPGDTEVSPNGYCVAWAKKL